MLDLVEGNKVIFGKASTGLAASGYGDWINCENMHTVWAICQSEAAGALIGTKFTGYVSESYAGGTPVKADCQYWYSTGLTIDRMIASTVLDGVAVSNAAAGGMVAIKFDPASRSASSQKYFSVAHSSGDHVFSITYIAQPRYAGLGQILATTSST